MDNKGVALGLVSTECSPLHKNAPKLVHISVQLHADRGEGSKTEPPLFPSLRTRSSSPRPLECLVSFVQTTLFVEAVASLTILERLTQNVDPRRSESATASCPGGSKRGNPNPRSPAAERATTYHDARAETVAHPPRFLTSAS